MKTPGEIKTLLGRNLPGLSETFGIDCIYIFGSYSRSGQTSVSDVDIMVHLTKPLGLLFCRLQTELKQLLGVDVDLLTRRGLERSRIWNDVKGDLIRVDA